MEQKPITTIRNRTALWFGLIGIVLFCVIICVYLIQ